MKILLLAGEESGVIYANQLKERLAGHEVRGYGDYGFRTEDLAVIGVDEVLRSFFYLLRVKRTMERAIVEWKPDVVCTIDYPGMNMRLAAFAKAHGFRTVHVVCPQVWAWKAGRIPKIQRIFDRLCCFLPFEPQIFRPGFADFVGHPLVEQFARDAAALRARQADRASAEGFVLALLPGSRLGEIGNHLKTMLETVSEICAERPDLARTLKIVIPAANEKAHAAISRIVSEQAAVSKAPTPVVRLGGARELLMTADCAVVASGTATLEAALATCPTVLVYKAAPLFAIVARHVIKGVRFLGLANIIWDKSMAAQGKVPPPEEAPMHELLQENLTVGNLRRELLPLLTDPAARQAAKDRLSAAIALLKSDGDAIGRIAEIIQSCSPLTASE